MNNVGPSVSPKQPQPQGLFLGAGFSVEMRMPLVRELTENLYGVVAQNELDFLFTQFGRWLDPPPPWKRAAAAALASGQIHYEQYAGQLEQPIVDIAAGIEDGGLEDAISHRLWFVELVSWMLVVRHAARRTIEQEAMGYGGIRRLVEESAPLWVFSLNHDVCFEVIAATFNLPLATCAGRLEALPRTDDPTEPARIVESSVSSTELRPDRHLVPAGETGVNLLKLHGSLNEFVDVDEDGTLEVVHMAPSRLAPLNWIDLIWALNHGDWGAGRTTVPLNHLPLRSGRSRHLMRTVLTGSNKMSDERLLHFKHGGPALSAPEAGARSHLPAVFQRPEMSRPVQENYSQRLFAIVDDVLPSLDQVTVLGCSLGDRHVTDRLVRWLEGNPRGELTVVGPDQHEVPPCFGPVARRVHPVPRTTRAYLDALAQA